MRCPPERRCKRSEAAWTPGWIVPLVSLRAWIDPLRSSLLCNVTKSPPSNDLMALL